VKKGRECRKYQAKPSNTSTNYTVPHSNLSAVIEYTERSKEGSNSCLKSNEEALWVGFQMIKENFFIKGHRVSKAMVLRYETV
jgi:hypothetical protein